jgi:hypothetical protein
MDKFVDLNIPEEFSLEERLEFMSKMCEESGLAAGIYYSDIHLGGRNGDKVIYFNIARGIHTIKELNLDENNRGFYAISFYEDIKKDPLALTFVDQNQVHHMGFRLIEGNYILGSFIDNLIFIYERLNEEINKNRKVFVSETEVDRNALKKILADKIHPFRPEVFL